MTARITRSLQILMAIIVTACIISVEILVAGPDIDGRTPGLADIIQIAAIDIFLIGAFAGAAIALFCWPKFGWWLSIALDGLLALAVASMVAGDFKDRFMVTHEGREAFQDDLILHAIVLLLCTGTIGFLLSARTQFLTGHPDTPLAPSQSPLT